jgi:hypothetical protein
MSEELLRIEYKLDLIISALQEQGVMLPAKHLPQMKDSAGDICPVCESPIRFTIDLKTESTKRTCRCAPALQAVAGISALLTPPTQEKNNVRPSDRSTQEDSDSPDEAPPGPLQR